MKPNKFLTIPIMALLLWLAGCKGDEPVQPDPVAERDAIPQMTFKLALSAETNGTRASDDADHSGQTWTPSSSTADPNAKPFDNTIRSIKVVLYRVIGSDSRLNHEFPVAELSNIIYDTDDKDGLVTVKGTLDGKGMFSAKDLEEGPYRLVVFVNPPSDLNTKNPAACTFSEHGNSLAFTGGIPMYGVADVNFSGLSENTDSEFQLKGSDGQPLSISILRSVAKIKVQLSNDLYKGIEKEGKNVRLVSMTVNHHAKKGYLCPGGWNTVSTLLNTSHESVFRPFTAETAADAFDSGCVITPYTGTDLDKGTDENNPLINTDKMLRFYCPDTYNNGSDGIDGTEPISLHIKYTVDGDPREDDIYLCKYSTAGAHNPNDTNHKKFDIIRNHIYLFNITGVKDNFKLECEVSIQKWGYHKITTEL